MPCGRDFFFKLTADDFISIHYNSNSQHHSHLISVPSCAVSACFWLVVEYEIVYQQPFKASVYFIVVV
jgi:hypothetical protein